MLTLLPALAGFAFLDSLDLLLIGVTAAVVYDSRLRRRSPVPGGASFLAGVFVTTVAFGVCTVLGIGWLTDLVDFRLTPAIRYRGELAAGTILLVLAALPSTGERTPPRWAVELRGRPAVLAATGLAIGIVQSATSVPYLAGLAMLSAHGTALWPVILPVYGVIALLPPVLVLVLATRRTVGARRAYRAIVRGITRFGPPSVRVLFAVAGAALVLDALAHPGDLW
ncbi:GAP family protein [Nocardia farcinica]|uniref:GAP family protein n=1 Tax=Nocardia farcinica TaxID=37329 RepID=UPI001893324C|nr:GAP family protein [Nocardia farcinica]MBF6291682.1 GAP family protein [Nocardia farcinica]MBF6378028.1 GAP family protein [Nocardia farcinica]